MNANKLILVYTSVSIQEQNRLLNSIRSIHKIIRNEQVNNMSFIINLNGKCRKTIWNPREMGGLCFSRNGLLAGFDSGGTRNPRAAAGPARKERKHRDLRDFFCLVGNWDSRGILGCFGLYGAGIVNGRGRMVAGWRVKACDRRNSVILVALMAMGVAAVILVWWKMASDGGDGLWRFVFGWFMKARGQERWLFAASLFVVAADGGGYAGIMEAGCWMSWFVRG